MNCIATRAVGCALLLLVIDPVGFAAERETKAKLLLWSTLDDDQSITNPKMGTGVGATLTSTDFVTGQIGKGLQCSSKAKYASFPQKNGAVKNIELDRGTVDFWYRPNYDHDDGIEYVFFQSAKRSGASGSTVTTAGSIEIGKHNAPNLNALFFIYWDASNTRWESTVQTPNYSWKAGDWVNIRVAWDWTVDPGVQNIHVYLNSEEVPVIGRDPGDSPYTGPKTTIPESAHQDIYIGGQPFDGGGLWQTDGVVDNLRIWDRPMPPDPD